MGRLKQREVEFKSLWNICHWNNVGKSNDLCVILKKVWTRHATAEEIWICGFLRVWAYLSLTKSISVVEDNSLRPQILFFYTVYTGVCIYIYILFYIWIHTQSIYTHTLYTVHYVDVVSHSALSDSAAPWTVAHQAFLSMEFSRQEYWSGLPFPTPGDLPNPGIELASLLFPALVDGFFTTCATWEAHCILYICVYVYIYTCVYIYTHTHIYRYKPHVCVWYVYSIVYWGTIYAVQMGIWKVISVICMYS